MDYAHYGLNPDEALPAAQQENYIQLEAKALEAEGALEATNDAEDREILAERAAEARAKADEARVAQRMTKVEALVVRQNLLANQARSLAQQHLNLECQKATATKYDLALLEGEQAALETALATLDRIFEATRKSGKK